MHSVDYISRYTTIQIQFEDNGSRVSSQRATYHDAKGQEVFPHLNQPLERETCRYIEFMLIFANMPTSKGERVCCFEYTSKVDQTFKVEVIHPIHFTVKDDSDQMEDQRRYQCLSQIAFRMEKCFGTTVGCNDSYENLLPPFQDFSTLDQEAKA